MTPSKKNVVLEYASKRRQKADRGIGVVGSLCAIPELVLFGWGHLVAHAYHNLYLQYGAVLCGLGVVLGTIAVLRRAPAVGLAAIVLNSLGIIMYPTFMCA